MQNRISINGRNGTFGAYIARPETAPAPAVVVLHEVFGINADIREKCDELAEQGFVGVAPELYWRQEKGVDLSVRSEPDWQHGLRLNQAYDRDGGFRAPMLMHLGEEDEFISKAAQAQIKAALAGKPNVTIYSYPGQWHAFTRINGVHYNAEAAALANGRTSEFLKRQLL
jgi:dienelactone hydrolase